MLRKSEHVRCSLYRRLYFVREELASTGTRRVQTVKDVTDFSSRTFTNREEDYEDDFYSGEKGLDVNDTVSLLL